MSQPQSFPVRPNLEYLKKLCKKKAAALRAAGKPAKLTTIQLAVARHHGFPSWRALKASIESLAAVTSPPQTLIDAFLEASLPPANDHRAGTLDEARRLLTTHPELAHANLYTACILGNAKDLARHLQANPSLAKTPGGPKRWLPLCYLTFSRFLRFEPERTADFVQCAKLLLQAGADPNSFYINSGDNVRESALYGASGLANNAPLTKLLLPAGADVNDGESLYHTAEFPDHTCLKLLLTANPAPHLDDLSYCMCHKMDFEDPTGLALFLEHGANPNFLIDRGLFSGYRPLHFAILRNRSPQHLTLLLEAGSDPNLPATPPHSPHAPQALHSPLPLTPYALARRLGHTKLAQLLLKHGAIDNLTPQEEFLAACSAGNSKTARTLLKQDPTLLTNLTPADHRLLVAAAKAGHLKALKLMLDLGFPIDIPGDSTDWQGTPLHHALWNGRLTSARLLLDRGANTNLRHQWDGDALQTAIHGATHGGHNHGLQIVKLLTSRLTPTPDWPLYLTRAKELGHPAIIAHLESLLRAQSDDPAIQSLPAHRRTHKITQWKPIMDAAYTGDAARIRKLLTQGADPNAISTTPQHYRPLHRAMEFKKTEPRTEKHEQAVRALLEGGADPHLRGGWDQLTALGMAALDETRFIPLLRPRFEPLDIFHAAFLADVAHVKTLFSQNPQLATARDANQWTPLHYAANSNLFRTSTESRQALLTITQLLLDAGADLTATYLWDGKWPISILYGCTGRHDFPELAELLMQAGANPCDSESVYHAADECHTGSLAIIERLTPKKALAKECSMCLSTTLHWGHTRGIPWLLAHGADPNTLNRHGNSALHEAILHNTAPAILKQLLDHGANPALKNKDGRSALDLARQHRRTKILALLKLAKP